MSPGVDLMMMKTIDDVVVDGLRVLVLDLESACWRG
jgi:hypothetical protein